jgi:CubicO group peptidase (beta-lactamase class C family)
MSQTNSPRAPTSLEGIETTVEDLRQRSGAPGVALAVVSGSEVVYIEGFAERDVEAALPVTPTTLFSTASVTKAFTAAAVALMVDDGLVEWDLPVRRYLPAFSLYERERTRHVLVRDLLTHTLGIPGHYTMVHNRRITRTELVERLRDLEPFADVRTIYDYSNPAYITAGALVDAVAGASWEDVVRTRLFAPLRMTTSTFGMADAQYAEDCARPYELQQGTAARVDYYIHQHVHRPIGSIVSNVVELANWLMLHLNAGRFEATQLISAEQMKQMHTTQIPYRKIGRYPERPGGNSGYGFGWSIDEHRGHRILSHGGAIRGFSSRIAFAPDLDAGVVVLANLTSAGALCQSIALHVFDRYIGGPPIPWYERSIADARLDREAVDRNEQILATRARTDAPYTHPGDAYAGCYEHPAYGVVEIAHEEGQLRATHNDIVLPLSHYHFNHFRFGGCPAAGTAEFKISPSGRIGAIAMYFESLGPAVTFVRIHADDIARIPALTGSYALATGEIFTIRAGRDEKSLVCCLPLLDGRLTQFIPDGDLYFVPVDLDPALFALSFNDDLSRRASVTINGRGYEAARVDRIES